MKLEFLVFLIGSYLIAFSINLIPSIKYPDSSLNIFNLLATSLFLVAFLLAIKKGASSGRYHKRVKLLLLVGFASGLVVYVFKLLEDTLMNYAILDVIASIQYPFYLLFITPLFGVNYLLDMSYGTFSLLMSAVYVLIFISVISFKKVDAQNV